MSEAPFQVRSWTTRVVNVGAATSDVLPGLLDELGAKRVFLLASATLSGIDDAMAPIRRSLGSRLVVEYSRIRPHVPFSDLVKAVAALRFSQADIVVAVGGGSIGEAGKVLPLCLKYGVTSDDDAEGFRAAYQWDGTTVQRSAETAPELPVICVPTTLSGGEYNHRHGVTWPDVGKRGIGHELSAPWAVIQDPYLAAFTPDWAWHSTGMRAVDHAVEGLVSPWTNNYWRTSGVAGLAALTDGLRAVAADTRDTAGRELSQLGAWQVITPLLNGVPFGLSHAIGHSLGGLFDVPHGYSSCAVMAAVQEWNAEMGVDGLNDVARALGRPGYPVDHSLRELILELGLPSSLGEVGVAPGQHRAIAESAFEDRPSRTNPRAVGGADDIVDVLRLAQTRRS
ncbi:iron-containing alcohol dehydrogenase [Rhodococcus pseudokoreensis]|uniref:Iron-containing alcohol dehydrogenase n=1 Tax=Rhodococcus pseudokoreensis TaxID=2811421 RepID=A0A974W536_9NOCA|nr:iron-containing alcohol dehydrogenase [Rhodococcus pseudokoreensis]QSE90787.1 iron-containing alcohol dehydrogenase [Rhodococcus pseudokoreensis]